MTACMAGSLHNDDGQHPITVKNIHFDYVDPESKLWLFRPNAQLINPNDCGNMDCDGQKKNLLTDLDGSFLNSPGTVISQSEYEWANQQRGLGDFKIPLVALVEPNGTMLNASQIYKFAGIVRDQQMCTYKPKWQAYECHGLDYRMMMIESMDIDTEKRRIAPIAIISDDGYLDLINGNQGKSLISIY